MAAKRKPTKKAAKKGGRIGGKSKPAGKGKGAKPKFGTAAWFAKYPKAKKRKKK